MSDQPIKHMSFAEHPIIWNTLDAPHICSDPACPGDMNRRKLEEFDALKIAAANLPDDEILRIFGDFKAARELRRKLEDYDRMKAELDKWRPLTPEEAQKACDEARDALLARAEEVSRP